MGQCVDGLRDGLVLERAYRSVTVALWQGTGVRPSFFGFHSPFPCPHTPAHSSGITSLPWEGRTRHLEEPESQSLWRQNRKEEGLPRKWAAFCGSWRPHHERSRRLFVRAAGRRTAFYPRVTGLGPGSSVRLLVVSRTASRPGVGRRSPRWARTPSPARGGIARRRALP